MQDKNTNMVKKKLCTSSFSKHGLPTPQVHISPSSYCHPEAVNSISIKMASAILNEKVLLPSVVRQDIASHRFLGVVLLEFLPSSISASEPISA